MRDLKNSSKEQVEYCPRGSLSFARVADVGRTLPARQRRAKLVKPKGYEPLEDSTGSAIIPLDFRVGPEAPFTAFDLRPGAPFRDRNVAPAAEEVTVVYIPIAFSPEKAQGGERRSAINRLTLKVVVWVTARRR
jgi:hypothetical protein